MLNCTSVHHCGICSTNFTLGIIFALSLLQIYDKLENIDAEIRKRENEGTGITWHQVQVIAFLHKKVNISCSTFVLNCVCSHRLAPRIYFRGYFNDRTKNNASSEIRLTFAAM